MQIYRVLVDVELYVKAPTRADAEALGKGRLRAGDFQGTRVGARALQVGHVPEWAAHQQAE